MVTVAENVPTATALIRITKVAIAPTAMDAGGAVITENSGSPEITVLDKVNASVPVFSMAKVTSTSVPTIVLPKSTEVACPSVIGVPVLSIP